MAKNRTRTDWQLDLKPVALATPADRVANSNGNGSHPTAATSQYPAAPPVATPPSATSPNPALTKALGELRAADEAVLGGLGEIRAALLSMRASIDELAGRVGAMESRLSPQPAAPTRPVRETSRALRDSTTGSLERRTRRGAAQPDEKAEK